LNGIFNVKCHLHDLLVYGINFDIWFEVGYIPSHYNWWKKVIINV